MMTIEQRSRLVIAAVLVRMNKQRHLGGLEQAIEAVKRDPPTSLVERYLNPGETYADVVPEMRKVILSVLEGTHEDVSNILGGIQADLIQEILKETESERSASH